MPILLTGGAGFIGSHIADQLIAQKYQVIILDNLSTGKKANIPREAKLYNLDICDKKIEEIFKKEKIEAVFHLAAQIKVPKSISNPAEDAKINILGMLNLLENCVKYKIKKFVFSSTGGALYGEADILPTPENYPTFPLSPYGISKLSGEHYIRFYNQAYGLAATILRYSNVYGPRQDSSGEGGVVSIFIEKILNNITPTINGSGRQTRDFIFVEDVAHANLLALKQKSKKLNIYNISQQEEVSIKDLFQKIASLNNFKPKPKFAKALKGEVNRSLLSNQKAKKELGWSPKYNLEQGLEKTLEFFKNFK